MIIPSSPAEMDAIYSTDSETRPCYNVYRALTYAQTRIVLAAHIGLSW